MPYNKINMGVGLSNKKNIKSGDGRIKIIKYSPWLVHFNTGACNGCDIEVLAAITPHYDPERFGIKLAPSVRHGDILVVTGAVTKKAAERLKRLYEQMPNPKFVIAVGDCVLDGGVFKGSYAIMDGIQDKLPVDIWIKGCPPEPIDIISGLLKLFETIKKE